MAEKKRGARRGPKKRGDGPHNMRLELLDPDNPEHLKMMIGLADLGHMRHDLLFSYEEEMIRERCREGKIFLLLQGGKPKAFQIITNPEDKFILKGKETEVDLSNYAYGRLGFVHPEERGKGIGKKMLELVTDWLKENRPDVRGIYYQVGSTNGWRHMGKRAEAGELAKASFFADLVDQAREAEKKFLETGEREPPEEPPELIPSTKIKAITGSGEREYKVRGGVIYIQHFEKKEKK